MLDGIPPADRAARGLPERFAPLQPAAAAPIPVDGIDGRAKYAAVPGRPPAAWNGWGPFAARGPSSPGWVCRSAPGASPRFNV